MTYIHYDHHLTPIPKSLGEEVNSIGHHSCFIFRQAKDGEENEREWYAYGSLTSGKREVYLIQEISPDSPDTQYKVLYFESISNFRSPSPSGKELMITESLIEAMEFVSNSLCS